MARATGWLSLFLACAFPAFAALKPLPFAPETAQKIGPVLDRLYYNPAALKNRPEGVLPPGVFVGSPLPAALPIRTEVLPGNVGFWRLRNFNLEKGKNWTALDTEIGTWYWTKKLPGLVLDLRNNNAAAKADFDVAARIASYFVPPQATGAVHPLFSLQSLRGPEQVFSAIAPDSFPITPLFPGTLVVLVNPQTGGAAATLATLLRREAGAILIGRTPSDSSALLESVALDTTPPSIVRVATAVATLPDGISLLGQPATPDISLYIDDKAEQEILAQIALGPAAKGLVEAPLRHHMNEASLVHEENPEIADYLTSPARATADEPLPLQDTALLRALDILKGLTLFPVAAQ
ncbi:S41 family peptidase [Verrucomicrobium sp. GAS474]|uniref:S41 family peptidase n=1 Tax=Verrucomicrobium sp. GAS474 TaxID=1882831 RepID=UPI0012FF69C0|nr:S41 family peptidase [Verrucomicrobium sp. GAS474]